MTKVVSLEAYRRGGLQGHRPPIPLDPETDTIVIRWRADGTYTAQITGAYASSPILAIEHVADLASRLARKERLR